MGSRSVNLLVDSHNIRLTNHECLFSGGYGIGVWCVDVVVLQTQQRLYRGFEEFRGTHIVC
jgi:hypothetical protein